MFVFLNFFYLPFEPVDILHIVVEILLSKVIVLIDVV